MDRHIARRRRSLRQRWRLRSIRTFDELRRTTGNGYARGRLYDALFGTNVTALTGGPGSVFVGDTFGLHRGTGPGSRPRLTTWIRYGLFPNEAFHADGTRAVPASRLPGRLDVDDRKKFICRLIIDR